MRNKLLLAVWLILVSLMVFSCRQWLAAGYQSLLIIICSLLLPAARQTINLTYNSSVQILPFIVLMLATPAIVWQRRLLFSVLGLSAYLLIDLLCILCWPTGPGAGAGMVQLTASHAWLTLGQWVFPFLFWFMAVRDRLLRS